MPTARRRLRSALIGLCLLYAACSSLAPPETCGPGADGPPDEAKYAEAIRSIVLVSAGSGLAGEPDEDGIPVYVAGDGLQILIDNVRALNIRACVQERRSRGRIATEREGVLPAGRAIIPLGSFEKGEYVARVMVDRVLVGNIPFNVQEADD